MSVFRHGWGGLTRRVTPIIRCQATRKGKGAAPTCDPLPDSSASVQTSTTRLQYRPEHLTSRLQLTSQQRNAPQFSASPHFTAHHLIPRLHLISRPASPPLGSSSSHVRSRLHFRSLQNTTRLQLNTFSLHLISRLQLTTAQSTSRLHFPRLHFSPSRGPRASTHGQANPKD